MRRLVFQLLSVGLGLALVAAASLKLVGTSASSVPLVGWTASAEFQVGLILVELALGVALLSGVSPVVVRWLAVGVFATFAGYSGYVTLTGTSSCGCFGELPVRPVAALVFDLLAVAGLLVGRPAMTQPTPAPTTGRVWDVALGLTLSVVVAGSVAAAMVARAGSLDAAVLMFRGEEVSFSPAVLDVGSGPEGEVCEHTVQVSNHSGRPVRLVAGSRDCTCDATPSLPVTLPPGRTRDVLIRTKRAGDVGQYSRSYALTADHRYTAPYVGTLSGVIR